MGLVQVIPLGGAGEIGKNCTLVVQGDDIVIIDAGLSFPDEDQYGIDIVVPDFAYLAEHGHKVRAVVLTHAHEDHVGALTYLAPFVQCPIYGTRFTLAMVRSKLEERARGTHVDLVEVQPGSTIEAGSLSVELVRVTHSIPETCCAAVRTEHGIVLFTTDFKFDFTPVDGKMSDIPRLSELGREGVVCLVSDSTNADRPGWGPSESIVSAGLRKAFEAAPGRVLLTTFASNIHRMQQTLDVAKATGRKVSVAGRRMEQTLDLCSKLGYLRMPKDTFVRLDDVSRANQDSLVILTTGSQGEPMAALSQMSRGEYSRLKIQEGDTIVYSARPIPGNEAAIWRTVNRLFKMGATVISDSNPVVHVSGHAYQEELKMMINLTQPYYVAPVHGEPRHQHLYRQMATAMGIPEHRQFTLANGSVLSLDDTKAFLDEPIPAGDVLIDSHHHEGVSEVVMRQRTTLGHDGVFVVTLGIDATSGTITKRPTLQARGFSGNQQSLDGAMEALVSELGNLRPDEVRNKVSLDATIRDVVQRSLWRSSGQRPEVIVSSVDVGC